MPFKRKWLTLAVLIGVLVLTLNVAMSSSASAQPTSGTTPHAVCCGSGGSFYGANPNWMATATNDWPQDYGNWCGIADVSAIKRYDWINYNGTDPGGSQNAVYNRMISSAGISPWGTANTNPWGVANAPYVSADIAADSGEDPRAQAWAAWDATPNGYYFHNYNYSPYQGSNNNNATYQVALDFGPAHGMNHPIIVIINGGRHSLIQDGVYASSDPSTGGETLYAVDLWDSAFSGQGTGYLFGYRNASVSISDWESGTYGTSGYYFWAYPYDAGDWQTVSAWSAPNVPIDPHAQNNLTRNTGDPDPNPRNGTYYTVHYFNSGVGLYVHWENAFVTIEQDTVTTCSASPNYALDRYGNLAAYNGSTACG